MASKKQVSLLDDGGDDDDMDSLEDFSFPGKKKAILLLLVKTTEDGREVLKAETLLSIVTVNSRNEIIARASNAIIMVNV
jgi:hypothetical protein